MARSLATALCSVAVFARADVLIGTNGDRFTGNVVAETADAVVFDTELGGRLTVPRSRIRALHREAPPGTGHRPLDTNAPSAVATSGPASQPPALGRPSGLTNSALPDLSWTPPPDRFDWIQLKTGEWLKGRLKGMQDRSVDFWSEKLTDLTFDWKDIRQVRSPRTIDVLLNDKTKVSGPVSITPDEVTIDGTPAKVVSRTELQSLTPGGAKERDYWSGDVSLGLTVQAGNTRGVQYNAQADLQRRTPATRLSLDYIGNFSRANGIESANNHRLNSEFDRWLSRRFYLIVPSFEYYKDPFQNLSSRVTAGVGVGYELIDRPNLEWAITTGPAYQQAWFDSTGPGDQTGTVVGALNFGSRFKWDINRRVKYLLQYRGQYTSREVGETTHHLVSTFSVDLNKRFTLDLSAIWDRISEPKAGAGGVRPEPDDFSLVAGLGVHF